MSVDICAHFDPLPISGIVQVNPMPYTGDVLARIATPAVASIVDGFLSTGDVALYKCSRIEFIDSLFADASTVPDALRWAWVGQGMLESSEDSRCALFRTQDPSGFFAHGGRGLPLLCVVGTDDKLLRADAIVAEMQPHFKKMQVVRVQGGSHALHIDAQEELVRALVAFVYSIEASA